LLIDLQNRPTRYEHNPAVDGTNFERASNDMDDHKTEVVYLGLVIVGGLSSSSAPLWRRISISQEPGGSQ
jgi:hypothetical protein